MAAEAEVEAAPKKKSSYTYWVRQATCEAAPLPAPKTLSGEEIVQCNRTHLGSLWNQAGTWEERNMTSWATKRLKELLLSIEPLNIRDVRARVIEITSCAGDASIVTVRNKKRVGYSYEFVMKYQGSWRGEKDVEGTLKVAEACFNELDDLQLQVTFSKDKDLENSERKQLTEALNAFLPAIQMKLKEFEEELKSR